MIFIVPQVEISRTCRQRSHRAVVSSSASTPIFGPAAGDAGRRPAGHGQRELQAVNQACEAVGQRAPGRSGCCRPVGWATKWLHDRRRISCGLLDDPAVVDHTDTVCH
jgi:hypothetical protein